MIRGGAYKPRTSPYDFQGLGLEGLKILSRVANETGLVGNYVKLLHRHISKKHLNILMSFKLALVICKTLNCSKKLVQ